MLTAKQYELLRFLHERLEATGVSPSIDEMREALDLPSTSTIEQLLKTLEDRDFIRKGKAIFGSGKQPNPLLGERVANRFAPDGMYDYSDHTTFPRRSIYGRMMAGRFGSSADLAPDSMRTADPSRGSTSGYQIRSVCSRCRLPL